MKGYRTILINGALLLIVATDYIVSNGSLVQAAVSDPKMATLVLGGLNILNLVLRSVTDGPVGKGKKPEPGDK